MIPYDIACKPNGAPFAAKGETDPQRWQAVVCWLDEGEDRGVVWLIEGTRNRTACCTAKGWREHLAKLDADLVPPELLPSEWLEIPARLAEHRAKIEARRLR